MKTIRHHAYVALARVRRNLFGPVDHEETRRFVERELALMSQRDEELYEFDFVRERPRDGPPRRFLWERVRPGAVPVSYALRRLDFLGATAAVAGSTTAAAAPTDALGAAAAPPPSAAPAPATGPAPETTTVAAAPAERPPCTPASTRTRQSHIDDFMRTRKRPRSSDAEGGGGKAEGPAAKQQRKAASSSSPSSATAAAAAASRS